MIKRPTSVTVVAWYFIISAFFSLFAMARTNQDPMLRELMSQGALPFAVQQSLMFAGFVASLVAGAGFLMGYHWSRVLFVGWTLISLLVTLLTSPMKWMVIPAMLVSGVLAYFLFSRRANLFFRHRKTAADA
nr:hypothetical protein [uncultured Duganella sp.]